MFLLQATISQLIKGGKFEELVSTLITYAISLGYKLLIALIIFFIGRWIIKRILYLITKLMEKRNFELSLRSFLRSLISTILFFTLIIIIINVVGTQTVSLAALIASAGLAIGLAVKDNLANFAGGVMLLANRPFKAGDFIEAQDKEGFVQSIGILYTVLRTFDNKLIYIPNGPLSTGNITNYTSEPKRRVDITVGVEYGSDVQTVKKILADVAAANELILKDPAPFARLDKMNDSSVDYAFRVWTKVDNYWDVYFYLNEAVYEALNQNGIGIPFPQMTVHFLDKEEKITE